MSGAPVELLRCPKRIRSDIVEWEKSSEDRRELYERHAGWSDCGLRESLREFKRLWT